MFRHDQNRARSDARRLVVLLLRSNHIVCCRMRRDAYT
jgi:hypothetical protein